MRPRPAAVDGVEGTVAGACMKCHLLARRRDRAARVGARCYRMSVYNLVLFL